MKIVIATPLYPPDIEPTAVYVKELAGRLVGTGHEVSIVTYGRLPEPVEGVKILAIDKRAPLPVRLMRFRAALRRAARGALVYAENGPSVELALLGLPRRTPLIFHIGDPGAHHYAASKRARARLETAVMKRARSVITDSPLAKPEILPFAPAPDMTAYEASWQKHLAALMQVFTT